MAVRGSVASPCTFSRPIWNRRFRDWSVPLARCAALKERCPPRQKSRVERVKAKVKPLFTSVTVETLVVMLRVSFSRAGRSFRFWVRLYPDSYLRLTDSCINQLKAQGTSRTVLESGVGFTPARFPWQKKRKLVFALF